MKNFISLVLLACVIFVAAPGSQSVKACDRTSFVLDSLVFTGGQYTIFATACIGGGVQGVNKGAGGDTRDIAFGFYTPGGVPITVSAFTPAFITGDTTGCIFFGLDKAGFAGSAPFLSQGLIGYQDFFGCPTGYTCIGTTAQCGNPHSQCQQFTFTVDVVPDSVRLFGPEGGGNPVAGCYPNPDMVLDLRVLPVLWGDFYGESSVQGVNLNWSTLTEKNNDRFEVYRSGDGNQFEKIGEQAGAGSSSQLNSYTFFDRNPGAGTVHYKIRQVDFDGGNDDTEVISLSYAPPAKMSWINIGPVPTPGPVALSFLAGVEQDMSLIVFDVKGERVIQQNVAAKVGSNSLDLDLSNVNSGVYYLRLQGANQKLDYKLIKL